MLDLIYRLREDGMSGMSNDEFEDELLAMMGNGSHSRLVDIHEALSAYLLKHQVRTGMAQRDAHIASDYAHKYLFLRTIMIDREDKRLQAGRSRKGDPLIEGEGPYSSFYLRRMGYDPIIHFHKA